MEDVGKYILKSFKETCEVINLLSNDKNFHNVIEDVSNLCCDAINKGGKLMLAGNGGSAADAQHIAGELVSRFMFDRPGLPAIALTTDTSILTAIGNDYGYEKIFSRQIQANGDINDIFFAYSTSGKSINIIEGLKEAKEKKIQTVGLSGSKSDDNEMVKYCDYFIQIPSKSTPIIQECHLVTGHIICGLIETKMFA